MALTDKRKRFIEEYLKDSNQTQAAIRAGYSEKTARAIASEMMEDEEVQAYLKVCQEELRKHSTLTKLDKLKLLESIMAGENKSLTIKAIEVHNKMTGDNEPDQIEHTGEMRNIIYNKPKKK